MMGDVPDMVKQKNGGLARSIAFPLFSVSKSHRYAFNAFMLSCLGSTLECRGNCELCDHTARGPMPGDPYAA